MAPEKHYQDPYGQVRIEVATAFREPKRENYFSGRDYEMARRNWDATFSFYKSIGQEPPTFPNTVYFCPGPNYREPDFSRDYQDQASKQDHLDDVLNKLERIRELAGFFEDYRARQGPAGDGSSYGSSSGGYHYPSPFEALPPPRK